MNARTALSLILLSLAVAACGNKGPLVQAPLEMPVEPPADTSPAGSTPADAETAPVDGGDATPEADGDDGEGPAGG